MTKHSPWVTRALSALCLLVAFGASAETDAPDVELDELIDSSTGEIDGQMAMAIYPARFEGRKAVEILGLEDCSLRLKSRSDFEVLTRPCGEWFVVPPDRYLYWAEKDWQISPHAKRLVYVGGPFEGRGLVGAAPIGPGGRARLPDGFAHSADFQFRLIHAGAHEVDGLLRSPVSHRVALTAVGEGMLMPVGPTLASVYNTRTSRLEWLSRPFEVRHRETVPAALEKPAPDRAFLLVQLVRHKFALRIEDDTVRLRLRIGGTERKPDVRIALADGLYGVWYDLAPISATILAEGADSAVEPITVRLGAGAISSIAAELIERPRGANLDVDVLLPPDLERESARIEVRRLRGNEVVAEQVVEAGNGRLRFENLPTGVLVVEVSTRLGPFAEFVELHEQDEGYVQLAPELIELRGRVFRGEDPQPAILRFVTSLGSEIEVATDDEGRYQLISLEWLRSVSIDLADSQTPPWLESFRPDPIRRSRELDFAIPPNRFEVRVVDASTDEPVRGATVATENYHGEGESPDSRGSYMQVAETDADGIARLPPLRPGDLEFQVHASGYEPLSDKRRSQVAERDEERRFEVRLQPIGEQVHIQVLLPDDKPAAGAEVALVNTDGAVVARERTDGAGEVALSKGRDGSTVAIYHHAAAFSVRWLSELDHEGPTTWRLEPSAPPLTVQVLDPLGQDPLGHARIGIWSRGRLLSNQLLFLLSQRRPIADAEGYWSMANLPREEVGLVAWGPGSDLEAVDALTSMATYVSPPWPATVQLRAVAAR